MAKELDKLDEFDLSCLLNLLRIIAHLHSKVHKYLHCVTGSVLRRERTFKGRINILKPLYSKLTVTQTRYGEN